MCLFSEYNSTDTTGQSYEKGHFSSNKLQYQHHLLVSFRLEWDFVLSRFKSCHSVLSDCPLYLYKLQQLQNSAVQHILQACRWDPAKLLLSVLHCFHVQAQTGYKLAELSFSFFCRLYLCKFLWTPNTKLLAGRSILLQILASFLFPQDRRKPLVNKVCFVFFFTKLICESAYFSLTATVVIINNSSCSVFKQVIKLQGTTTDCFLFTKSMWTIVKTHFSLCAHCTSGVILWSANLPKHLKNISVREWLQWRETASLTQRTTPSSV